MPFILSFERAMWLSWAVCKTAPALPCISPSDHVSQPTLHFQSLTAREARTPKQCSSSETARMNRWLHNRFHFLSCQEPCSHRGECRAPPPPAPPECVSGLRLALSLTLSGQ